MGTNVLFLLSDEHARSALGAYGHPIVQTPTLDRLARSGTVFDRAYTPSPICIPARASLATGLHVFEHRCWSSAQPYYGQVESWMHRLRTRGHDMASIGKLHFRSGNDDNGFMEEILPMYLANDGQGWPQGLIRSPLPAFTQTAELAELLGPGESDYTDYDRKITTAACKWIGRSANQERSKPWALFVSFASPHYPLIAPQPFFDLYRHCEIREPFANSKSQCSQHPILREMLGFWNYDDYFDADSRRLARQNYYGLCSFVDDNIRQVLAALDDSGQTRDTVVIYTSDHGEMLGNHGFWAKSLMYEDSVAVPMIIAGRNIPVGVNNTPVSLTDMAATIETVVSGGEKPAGASWQSRALPEFITRPQSDRFILSEYHDGGSPTGFFMIRQGNWKYVYYAGAYPAHLFDLEHDPQETQDLGENAVYVAVREKLHGFLNQILDPDAVNAQAFAEQACLLEHLGGSEKVLAMRSFNHTPVGS
ncbi:MAG: sulfatase-like hydrolase/transferase [Acidiferrobacterales bacterium]